MEQAQPNNLLEMTGICKSFLGVPALTDVAFSIKMGEVHGLAGQNGAGKSTLIKILTGVYQSDKGSILFQRKDVSFPTPMDAQRVGISTIYQELNLVPNLSVAENIMMCKEPRKMGRLDWKAMRRQAADLMQKMDIKADVRELISNLSVAVQQMIAVIRAVSTDAKLIIMDEPTSALEDTEVNMLMDIIRKLKNSGVSILFVSHRLDEVFEICDRITVLRDGLLEGCYDTAELDKPTLISKMIGKREEGISEAAHRAKGSAAKDDHILEVDELHYQNKVKNMSFWLNRGEVLGVAGLLGAGKSEMAKSVFGVYSNYTGKVSLNGRVLTKKTPSYSIKNGVGFLSEDRKREGILPQLSVRENISVVLLPRISKFGMINKSAENKIVAEFVRKLGIKISSLNQKASTLSGGNQQKVLLARWLCTNPSLLLLDEPTRGIDVGAKLDVQRLIQKMVQEGVSVMMINSELEELSSACNRVLAVREGQIVGELNGEEVAEDRIINLIAEKTGRNDGGTAEANETY